MASLIADGVVAVVKFFRRCLETCKIQTFLRKAGAELQRIQNGKTAYDLGNAEANSGKSFSKLLDDPERFREFYQEGANASVCIPILTLNSGICGDLMQMARIYDDDDARITQQELRRRHKLFRQPETLGMPAHQGKRHQFQVELPQRWYVINHAINGHHGTQSTMQKVITTLAA